MNTTNDGTTIQTKKMLFITNSESGQANTILALALEAITRPQVEVHIASFPALKLRIERLSPELNFHPLDGEGMLERISVQGIREEYSSHPPTVKSLQPCARYIALGITGWGGESYMRIYNSVKSVIEELNPSLVVVDLFMGPGFEACYSLNREFVINTPNNLTDIARLPQPWLKVLWYYPAWGSGLPFPISWRDIPRNVITVLGLMWKVVTSPQIAKLNEYRHAHGLQGRLPIPSAQTRAVHVICPGIPEIDFPLVVPDYLGSYGPIVLDTAPVQSSDPELYQWLGRSETVIMSMGTHFHYTESQVEAVITGFLNAVDHDSDTQILWKLSGKSKFESLIQDALKDPRDKKRFRIVGWLEADPGSIMKHPNVVACIHHGGANTFFEAALAGLPQIILAQWVDLYDMAVRAEYRGIGVYGNKNVAPDIESVEFGVAVSRLVRPGKESEGFRMRAKVMAEACRKAGGKKMAVDKLLEVIEGKE